MRTRAHHQRGFRRRTLARIKNTLTATAMANGGPHQLVALPPPGPLRGHGWVSHAQRIEEAGDASTMTHTAASE